MILVLLQVSQSSSTPLSVNLDLFAGNSTQYSLFKASNITVAPSAQATSNNPSIFNVNWGSLNGTAAPPVELTSA